MRVVTELLDAHFSRVLSRYQTNAGNDKSIGLLLPVPSDSVTISKLQNLRRTSAPTGRRTNGPTDTNYGGAAVLDKTAINYVYTSWYFLFLFSFPLTTFV